MVLSRRAVLHAGAVATATGLAGCSLGFGGTNQVVDVTFRNDHDASHRLAVTITFDGSTLLDRTVALDPGETASASFDNPDTAGEAQVTVRRSDGSQTSDAVRVGPGTGIRFVTVEVTADGEVRILAART